MIRHSFAVVGLLVAMTAPGQAQLSNPAVGWRGVKVLPKEGGCVVKVGNETIDAQDFRCPLTVQDVSGDWLLVGDSRKGWVQKSQIVTLDEAPAYYTGLIHTDPHNASALLYRAAAWQERGAFVLAILDLNERLRIAPTGVAYNNRGIAWHSKKEYDKAIADYNQAIRLDPNYARSYSNRGWAWQAKKEYEKSIADFDESIRLDPSFVRAYKNRGVVWCLKKEYDRAIADFTQIVRLDPNDADAHYNLACCYAVQHQSDPAIDHLRDCLKLGFTDLNLLKSDSDLDSIRSDSRYQELVRQYSK